MLKEIGANNITWHTQWPFTRGLCVLLLLFFFVFFFGGGGGGGEQEVINVGKVTFYSKVNTIKSSLKQIYNTLTFHLITL